jgi:hypothetical protein
MVFCAADNQGQQDISFPHQSEIKVNGGEVKANLRGLKNKPGSTRPVDITKELRLKIPQYSNNVELTYALTNKVDGGSLHVSCLQPLRIPRIYFPLLMTPWHHSSNCTMLTLGAEILSPYVRGQYSARSKSGKEVGDWTTDNQGDGCQ